MKFYLGTHETSWLRKVDVPLFISANRLRRRKTFPRATCDWALDSGGFTEIGTHGRWITDAKTYAAEAVLWSNAIGRMDWAAIQDWMCEPHMLKLTGKSVEEHQALTVQSYSDLRGLAPEITWMPVLQGWSNADYLRHIDMYRAAGFDDMRFGLGSVCRRQETGGVSALIAKLRGDGFELHAFGFKLRGLAKCSNDLDSADSMAWSFNARKNPPLPGCTHQSCANCIKWALRWRTAIMGSLQRQDVSAWRQIEMWGFAA